MLMTLLSYWICINVGVALGMLLSALLGANAEEE
jgi:hypothetical protein